MDSRFTLRNIYLYAICLITLLITIFALVSLVRNSVELFYPDPVFYTDPSGAGPTKEEIIDSQRRQAMLGIVTSCATLMITVPLYIYHWTRVQRERRVVTD